MATQRRSTRKVEEDKSVDDVNVDNVDVESVEEDKSVDDTQTKTNDIAIFATHPMHWPGVGELKTGFNILAAEKAEPWLDRGWARKATVSEVKAYYRQ